MRMFLAITLLLSSPVAAQGVVNAPVDLNGYATTTALSAMAATIPTPANATPPGVADAGALGSTTSQYARADHTHASKARKIVATSAADGVYTFNYSATPFTNPPTCSATAEVANGVTDVVNVQIIGTPSITSANFLVNRANKSVVSLISLTVLSVAAPGATKIHIICLEP